jgi:hypothetical protein
LENKLSHANDSDPLGPFPESGIRDSGRVALDAIVAGLPVVGGPAQVLMDFVMAPALARRQSRWFKQLGDVVIELQSRDEDFDISTLSDNETFISAVSRATQIAFGTHQEEKLQYLKNCLVHLAINTSIDDFVSQLMLTFVEQLSPEHVIVLQYFSDPSAWFDRHGITKPNIWSGTPMGIMEQARIPIGGIALPIVMKDLNDKGLANTGSTSTQQLGESAWRGIATNLGNQFLQFVQDS